MGVTNLTGGSGNSDTPPSSNGGLPSGFIALFGGAADSDDTDGQSAPSQLINYNEKFAGTQPTKFRDTVIQATIAALIGKQKPNALLVGPAGVGKTRVVEDIARRIADDDALIPAQLTGRTIYELPLSALVSGSSYMGQLEAKVEAVIKFASDPENKVILFIDEIHQLFSGHDQTYGQIAQIFKPALARGDLKVIGATTTQEGRDLSRDPALKRRFTRLVVDELTADEATEVLATVRDGLVGHYHDEITVDDSVLPVVTAMADAHAQAGSHRPDAGITLLDSAMADRILEQKQLIVAAEARGDQDTADALRAAGAVPLVAKRVEAVAKRLLTGSRVSPTLDAPTLLNDLTSTLQGQDDVVGEVVDLLERRALGVFPTNRPTVMMFAGPSGVGKTETAKVISQTFTDQAPIIISMSEYTSPSSVSRLLGSDPGYVGSDSNAEQPFDSLESNPYRVIVLDEFEKADRVVQRLFLPVFDEGVLTTASGQSLDFSKTIIVLTTNAAREELAPSPIGFGPTAAPTLSNRSLVAALAKHFDPELLGRFTLTVGFNPLDESLYRSILESNYARERTRIVAAKSQLDPVLPAAIDDVELDAMVERTYVASQGARPAGRAVRAWIEDTLIAAKR